MPASRGYEVVKQLPKTNPTTTLSKDMVYVKATMTNVPLGKGNNLDYAYFLSFLGEKAQSWVWLLFLPLIILIVTSVSNGSNLTDGIDGLATGVSAIVGGTLGILAYVSSHTLFAEYLNILYLPYTSELVVFSACFIGACIGF